MSDRGFLIESICTDSALLIALRREIHARPELGFEEQRTSDLIAQSLTEWSIPIHRGLGKTGIVGTIKNGTSLRAIALRADMDALPITELNNFDHRSVEAGKMHACGHDGHTAMLLAAAKHLSQYRNFDGTVYVIFQPAEEGLGGAREMMRDGLFKHFRIDAIFGIHNWPGLDVGKFALKAGPLAASSNEFRIEIRGKGGHAALPHNTVDPIPVACQMVQAFQTIITRNKQPSDAAVLSVTVIRAGEAANVISDSCEIRGTVRSFAVDVLDLVERRMRQISVATCQAFDATCTFDFIRKYPPTVNHAKETEFVREVLRNCAGETNVLEFEPTMGSEDFSFYLLEKPGCYFLIGNGGGNRRSDGHGDGPCLLHNPSYDFNDELIPIGGSMWVRLVEAWFKERGSG